MVSAINRKIMWLLQQRTGHQATKAELYSKLKRVQLCELSVEEKSDINNFWGHFPKNYNYWRFYKSMGITENLYEIVPDDIYTRQILRILNPIHYAKAFHIKNVYPIIYKELTQPRILINMINGIAYSNSMDIMSAKEILETLLSVERFIIKPTSGSCGGNGINIFATAKMTNDDIDSIIGSYGKNFVCQEIVQQSDITAKFSNSSLNTFRINSLHINGHTSVENIMFRHGQGNSNVDNFGMGGVCCGVENNGQFTGKAIDYSLNIHEITPFNIDYQKVFIPETKILVDYAINAHQHLLPMIGHVAWDFALSDKNEPIFIEVNLGWPGLISEQMSSQRPIFNHRTKEVLDYAIQNQDKLKITDFLGGWI